MSNLILSAIIGAAGGLVGALIGAFLSFRAEKEKSKNEQAKLVSSLISSHEVEKARIQAYTELWSSWEERWNRLRGLEYSNVLDARARYFSCFHFDPAGCFADPVAIRLASKAELGAVACFGFDGVRADWDGCRFPGSYIMVPSSQIRGKNPALTDHRSVDEASHSCNCASRCFRASSSCARYRGFVATFKRLRICDRDSSSD